MFFAQDRVPGHALQLDWTNANELGITIEGQPTPPPVPHGAAVFQLAVGHAVSVGVPDVAAPRAAGRGAAPRQGDAGTAGGQLQRTEFAGLVEDGDGVARRDFAERGLVRNPRAARVLQADGLGLGEHLLRLGLPAVVGEMPADGFQAVLGEEGFEFFRRQIVGAGGLDELEAEVLGLREGLGRVLRGDV